MNEVLTTDQLLIVKSILSNLVWLIISAFVLYIFRDVISNASRGLLYFFGSTINKEDYILLDSHTPARIKDLQLTRAVAQELSEDEDLVIETIIPYSKLRYMLIRKVITDNPFKKAKQNSDLMNRIHKLETKIEELEIKNV